MSAAWRLVAALFLIVLGNHQRRVQSLFADGDDSNATTMLPTPHDEWYLPDASLGEMIAMEMFGSGDTSEWGEHEMNVTSPIPIIINVTGLYAGEHIIDVSAGTIHSALITSDGRLFTSSGSSSSSLGLGRDTTNSTDVGFIPVIEFRDTDNIPIHFDSIPVFKKVMASDGFTFVIDVDGNAWSTGTNTHGQLCLNDTLSKVIFHKLNMNIYREDNEEEKVITSNVFLDIMSSKVVDVVLGARHTLLLLDDGSVYGCGWNEYGQLGGGGDKGGVGKDVLLPRRIAIIDEDVVSQGGNVTNHTIIDKEVVVGIAAGRGSSYFLTLSGSIYATGTNYNGQLCLGDRDDRTIPTALSTIWTYLDHAHDGDFSLSDENVTVLHVVASDSSVYILLTNGLVLACGDNKNGQLGIGNDEEDGSDFNSFDVPVAITNLTNIAAVFSGPSSLSARFVDSEGAVYAVGYDGSGMLSPDSSLPTIIACMKKMDENATTARRVDVSLGNNHALYLMVSTETSFECTDNYATISPSTTMPPTISSAPTDAPSTSLFPASTFMPSSMSSDGGVSHTPTIYSTTPAPSSTVDTEQTNIANGQRRWLGGLSPCTLVFALSHIIWHWVCDTFMI